MPIRVLIVDDSAFMRNALGKMLASDPDIEIAGVARDGVEALEKVALLKPDLVTMDVEMPRMDGIEALRRIMAATPLPVIMVSSLTTEGAKATLEALEIGAVDFLSKNLADLSLNILQVRETLLEKVRQIGRRRMRQAGRPSVRAQKQAQGTLPAGGLKTEYRKERRIAVVAIGTSTGGPKALQDIVPRLPRDFPVPAIIVQHMPPAFTAAFAERLNDLSQVSVKEAEEGEILKPGVVLVAPGRGHLSVRRGRVGECYVTIDENRPEIIYRPSVDIMMLSVAETFPGRALGVILTGMGNDGEKGMRAIKAGGGRTLAQNEETCVVYGMPKAAVEAGVVDREIPLAEVVGEIVNAV